MPNQVMYVDNKTNFKALKVLTSECGMTTDDAIELIEKLNAAGLEICQEAERVKRTTEDGAKAE